MTNLYYQQLEKNSEEKFYVTTRDEEIKHIATSIEDMIKLLEIDKKSGKKYNLLILVEAKDITF